MSPQEKDRRLSPRVEAEDIGFEYLAPVPRVRDISISGLYILDPRPFQRGQTIEFRITLGASKPFVATGMIRRVDPGQGMAVEFIHVDAAARRRIREFVAHADPSKISASGSDV